ncbi:hypothetical protein MXZ96_02375 [Providencia stuartii]|uniref:hypothetical protein n=1 Tax=Providencia stuartii TaxID=588 RepID=UPI00111D59B4|nr:hypothetical protein [Providencia stuartii]MCK1142197.1 hypothetical protein [Providencia stuartii]
MSKGWCPTCEKVLPKSLFHINIGDKVDFTIQRYKANSRGVSIKASSRTGKVIDIQDDIAIVLYRKQESKIHINNLSLSDIPNDLTRMVVGECECKSVEASDEHQ